MSVAAIAASSSGAIAAAAPQLLLLLPGQDTGDGHPILDNLGHDWNSLLRGIILDWGLGMWALGFLIRFLHDLSNMRGRTPQKGFACTCRYVGLHVGVWVCQGVLSLWGCADLILSRFRLLLGLSDSEGLHHRKRSAGNIRSGGNQDPRSGTQDAW